MLGMNIDFFRQSINKENLVKLDFNYLCEKIEIWWKHHNYKIPLRLAKFQLAELILKNARQKDIAYFDQVGLNHISGVTISNIFTTDCHKLARVVHETLSDLFGLTDIKYPYEEHKNIYLKPGGENYRNWGNGFGEITPHSDDLYEDLNIDFLSLTVCRDMTHTPTEIYFPKDILNNFNENEIARLLNLKVKFISGKNVSARKSRERNIIEYSPVYGFKFHIDLRIDMDVGERMLAINSQDKELIDKMRANITICKGEQSLSHTGTFTIIANYKVLHARAEMQIDRAIAIEIAKNNDYTFAPRLLFRSKGQDAKLIL